MTKRKPLNLTNEIMSTALTKIQNMDQKNVVPTCLCNFPPFLPTKVANNPVTKVRPPAIT